ncbi:MAG: quinone oxidoreductase family protein [Aeromicrobium sp.]
MTTAVRIHAPGGPDALSVDEVPLSAPGPGQLLVETSAVGVNFIDVYHRTGMYPLPLPATLGLEAAGVVTTVGEDVTRFAAGDRVVWPMQSASYATHVVVNADSVVAVPDDVDLRLAAASALQGMTAHFLATSIVPLGEGDSALVHAGAGGVGLLLTQLLHAKGVRVLTTVGSTEKAELSRAAGASAVFGYDDFATAARAATDGDGVRAVFDGVGASTFDGSLDALGVRGAMILFGAASGKVPPIDPQVLNAKGSLLLTRPSLGHFIGSPEELAWRAAEVYAAIADGTLDIRIGAEFALTDAADAHRALEGRQTTGKVLLIP